MFIIVFSSFFSFLQIDAYKSHIIGGNTPHGGHPNHEDIIFEALKFLRKSILSDISNEQTFVDLLLQLDSSYHFDSCNFLGSVNRINDLYNDAIKALNPNDRNLEAAPDKFGQLLHIVQDFYSHSNWIEIGKKQELIDDGLELWTPLRPNIIYIEKNIIVLQGTSIPSGFQLTRDGKNITVLTTRGNFSGLITGVAYTNPFCPAGVIIGHWDNEDDGELNLCCTDRNPGEREFGTGLNKDYLERPSYSDGKRLAIEQTKHEWCRLLNLVDKSYGQRGVDLILSVWVQNRTEAVNTCS